MLFEYFIVLLPKASEQHSASGRKQAQVLRHWTVSSTYSERLFDPNHSGWQRMSLCSWCFTAELSRALWFSDGRWLCTPRRGCWPFEGATASLMGRTCCESPESCPHTSGSQTDSPSAAGSAAGVALSPRSAVCSSSRLKAASSPKLHRLFVCVYFSQLLSLNPSLLG